MPYAEGTQPDTPLCTHHSPSWAFRVQEVTETGQHRELGYLPTTVSLDTLIRTYKIAANFLLHLVDEKTGEPPIHEDGELVLKEPIRVTASPDHPTLKFFLKRKALLER